MRPTVFIAGLILFAGQAASSLLALAQPEQCDNLVASICGPLGVRANERLARIDRTARELDALLGPKFADLATGSGSVRPGPGELLSSALVTVGIRFPHDFANAAKEASGIFEEVEKALLPRTAFSRFEEIQRRMTRVVLEKPGLNEDTRKDFVRRIARTRLVLPSEYIRSYAGTNDELWPLLTRLWQDSAWNIPVEDGSRVIILFPGLIAAEQGRADFVLAHELSHSFDFDTSPRPYEALTSCLERNHGVEAERWTEISADYWGVELLVNVLSEGRDTPEQTIRNLGQSHEILCDAPSEDPILGTFQSRYAHPPGEFRINQILGNHPVVRSLLGCTAPASETFCGITGAGG